MDRMVTVLDGLFVPPEFGLGVAAAEVRSTSSEPLGGFGEGNVEKGASVYTDDVPAYNVIDSEYRHESVNHTQKEYVRGGVHTNSIESF